MFSKYISINLIRRLRTPSKRVGSSLLKEENGSKAEPIIPMSEDDYQRLILQNKQADFEDFQFKSQMEQPIIDKTFQADKVDLKTKPLIKQKKKTSFIKLKDYVMKHPLTEPTTEENQFERLSHVVTPLYKVPYSKQLKIKQRHTEDVLKLLRAKMKEVQAPLSTTRDRLPCPVENIIPSPDLIHYRNKDEFSVHVGADGNPKTVGYFIGLPSDPLMRCVPPTHLINIKETHKLVAKHFETFIRSSPHNTCFKFSEGGVWRNLVVRSNLKEELMAVVTIYPGDLTEEGKEDIKRELRQYFFKGPGAECDLSSLHLQACLHSKCTREKAPFELIQGTSSFLEEECLGKRFRISPDSFFQTNTRAAEIVYDSIRKVSEFSPLTTLLDVCCGTGTISVLLGPLCRGAVGIDAVSGSIEDAKINAQNNGVHNVNYICGKIENILPILTRDLEDSSDVIAVVNPARAGLHPSVIQCIRECESIKKLIFVTCKPEGNALMNMAMLGSTLNATHKKWGRNNKYLGTKNKVATLCDPFILRYAIPIDMFPHTLHVEYVFLFERIAGY